MGSYFYKKLWDFLTFKEFLSENLSNDELLFYLHFRNLIFEGPQLNYKSATFEVVSYVPFERVKRLILIQFRSKDEIDDNLQNLIEKLESEVKNRGKNKVIDGYFSLRLILQFYIGEKKLYIEKLRRAFARVSIMGEKDLDAMLNFMEFREFIKSAFQHVNDLEIPQIYRFAWNVGNGIVNFSSFLTSAYHYRIILRELQMENTATLSISHVETKINQEMGSHMLSDEMNELLKPMEKLVYILYDEGGYIGNPHHLDSCDKLLKFMNRTLVFNSREELIYQGDKLNLIVNIWISLLKSVITLRSVSLESSKFGRPLKAKMSDVIRDEIIKSFKMFMKKINFEYLDPEVPVWADNSFKKLQKKVKKKILRKAKEHFEELMNAGE